VWFSGTQLDSEGSYGYGIEAGTGASVSVMRSRISENHSSGVGVFGSGTIVTVSEVWVSGTQLDAEGSYGYGIAAGAGASVSVIRTRVSENVRAGISAHGSGTSVIASELWVSGNKLSAEGRHGFGVSSAYGASVNVTRSRVSENHSAGISVGGSASRVEASEVWIFGTRANAAGNIGHGINVMVGASLSLKRSQVSDNNASAIAFIAGGGSVTESLLEGAKLDGGPLADGLMATGSVVTVTGVISRDNARAGVLFDKSDGELSGSLITQNAIGLANQGLPGATIADDNVIEGNDQDRLDDGDLEVPDEAMSLPEF
jgi:hypothetical protein